jgi:hypothetical protein
MRKRHVARPMLEPVEDRLVLSTSGVLAFLNPITEVRAAIDGLTPHHSHPTTAQATHRATTQPTHHATTQPTHHATAQATHHSTTRGNHTRSVAKHPHAATPTHAQHKSSSSNSLSNFLKSVFPGL